MRKFPVLPLWFLALPLLAQEHLVDPGVLEQEKKWIRVGREVIEKTVLVEVRLGGRLRGAGTGAVISGDGLVLTCAHVVEALQPQRVGLYEYTVVTSDGSRHKAKLLGRASANDIALLSIGGKDRPHYTLDPDRTPEVGEQVLAVGFPMGNLGRWEQSDESGGMPHPSLQLGRVISGSEEFVVMVQGGAKYYPRAIVTDTPVFMGNSGGPLVNEDGRLLGLNAAIMPAAGKTYSISVRTIGKVLATLEEGKDAAGERLERGEQVQKFGKTILEALGASFRGESPDRVYLRRPFERLAGASASGVAEIRRGERLVGYATLLDDRGHAVAALAALRTRTWGEILLREIDRRVRDSDFLRSLWEEAKKLLETPDPGIEAVLADGTRVRADIEKESAELGVALLSLRLGSARVKPIRQAPYARLEPGQWVISVGAQGDILGAGLLHHDHHSARGVVSLPTSLRDLPEFFLRGEGAARHSFKDVLMHDVALARTQLGGPVLDSRGRLIGVNIYHPARGTTYAARLDNLLRVFRLGSGF